jgi:hypothetical protein
MCWKATQVNNPYPSNMQMFGGPARSNRTTFVKGPIKNLQEKVSKSVHSFTAPIKK